MFTLQPNIVHSCLPSQHDAQKCTTSVLLVPSPAFHNLTDMIDLSRARLCREAHKPEQHATQIGDGGMAAKRSSSWKCACEL